MYNEIKDDIYYMGDGIYNCIGNANIKIKMYWQDLRSSIRVYVEGKLMNEHIYDNVTYGELCQKGMELLVTNKEINS